MLKKLEMDYFVWYQNRNFEYNFKNLLLNLCQSNNILTINKLLIKCLMKKKMTQ